MNHCCACNDNGGCWPHGSDHYIPLPTLENSLNLEQVHSTLALSLLLHYNTRLHITVSYKIIMYMINLQKLQMLTVYNVFNNVLYDKSKQFPCIYESLTPPYFKHLSPANVVFCSRRWSNGSRASTVISSITNKTHPFVVIHVEEEDIVVFVDHGSARLAPGINPEHLTKAYEPLVFIGKSVNRGGRAGAVGTVASSTICREPVATWWIVESYGISNTNRPWTIHAVDLVHISTAVVPVAAFHVETWAGVSDTSAPRASQPVAFAVETL